MKFQLLLVLALLFTFSFDATAVTTVVAVDGDATSLTLEQDNQKLNVFNKAGKWFKTKKVKAVTWVAKKMMAIDWSDPGTVIKYCLIAAIAAIVISIIGYFVPFLFIVSSLFWLAAVILFWYWVYLKFIA